MPTDNEKEIHADFTSKRHRKFYISTFVQAEAAGTNQTTVSQAGMTLSQQQFIQSIANDAQDLQKKKKY